VQQRGEPAYGRKSMVANEELDAFASSVAHDSQAPARHVAGFANCSSDDYSADCPHPPTAPTVMSRTIPTRVCAWVV